MISSIREEETLDNEILVSRVDYVLMLRLLATVISNYNRNGCAEVQLKIVVLTQTMSFGVNRIKIRVQTVVVDRSTNNN